MTHDVTSEDLVRYLDGELDGEETRAVERALERDPDLRATLRSLSEGATMVRAAFSEPIHGAAPDDLTSRIATMLSEARHATTVRALPARSVSRRRWFIPAAVAASVAIIALGLGGGYLISDARVSSEIARLDAARQEDRAAFELALQGALETQLSGTSVAWQGPGTGARGSITPIRTFKSANGQWCREYAFEADRGASVDRQHAIACRAPEGHWETRLPVFTDS